jgi:hypothetical protein
MTVAFENSDPDAPVPHAEERLERRAAAKRR